MCQGREGNELAEGIHEDMVDYDNYVWYQFFFFFWLGLLDLVFFGMGDPDALISSSCFYWIYGC